MPPKQNVLIHRSAKLTPEEGDLVYAWAKAERKRLRQLASAIGNRGVGDRRGTDAR